METTQSVLSAPGLYFSVKCRRVECQLCGKTVFAYIGVGREFLFTETWHALKCQTCGHTITSVCSVGFFRCRWTFHGTVSTGDEIHEDSHYSFGFSLCKGPLKHRWRELYLCAWNFTEAELEFTTNNVFKALESPMEKVKRPFNLRDAIVDAAPQRHLQSSATQTDEPTSPTCPTVYHKLMQDSHEKEEQYNRMSLQVSQLLEQVAEMKRRRNL